MRPSRGLRKQRRLVVERAQDCDIDLSPKAYVFLETRQERAMAAGLGRNGPLHSSAQQGGLEGIRLHDLRHYVVTHLLEAGVPVRAVSEHLGHANATTTLGIYPHAVLATDQRSAELLGDLLAPKETTPSKRKRSPNQRSGKRTDRRFCARSTPADASFCAARGEQASPERAIGVGSPLQVLGGRSVASDAFTRRYGGQATSRRRLARAASCR